MLGKNEEWRGVKSYELSRAKLKQETEKANMEKTSKR